MKMYRVTQAGDLFSIVETKTNQVIKSLQSKKRAKKIASAMSNGSGFHGFTPNFIVANAAPNSVWSIID